MNNAKRLINDFVDEKLQGNLSELPHFDFARLQGDRKYGTCNGGSFDCDNTNLSKAIYLLVFEGVWNNMTPKSLENGMYRGDTINTFNTIFGRPIAKGEFAAINRFKPDHKLQQRVKEMVVTLKHKQPHPYCLLPICVNIFYIRPTKERPLSPSRHEM